MFAVIVPLCRRRGRGGTQSGPTSARVAAQIAHTGRATVHAPRRAGPEPGAAALAGRDRDRHAARTGITTLRLPLGELWG
jgi:hypothetical protein